MDPFTILGGLSAGIKAGKQLYSLKNQVTEFFDVVDEGQTKAQQKRKTVYLRVQMRKLCRLSWMLKPPKMLKRNSEK